MHQVTCITGTTWLLIVVWSWSLLTGLSSLKSKIKKLEHWSPPFSFLQPHCDSEQKNKIFLFFILHLDNIFDQNYPRSFSLLVSHFCTPSNSQPQNTQKMSQLPKQHAPAPARALRFNNNENGLGSLAFFKAFLKDWLVPLILSRFPKGRYFFIWSPTWINK